jgi:hypothetical protein
LPVTKPINGKVQKPYSTRSRSKIIGFNWTPSPAAEERIQVITEFLSGFRSREQIQRDHPFIYNELRRLRYLR